jgi:hypothetical protein
VARRKGNPLGQVADKPHVFPTLRGFEGSAAPNGVSDQATAGTPPHSVVHFSQSTPTNPRNPQTPLRLNPEVRPAPKTLLPAPGENISKSTETGPPVERIWRAEIVRFRGAARHNALLRHIRPFLRRSRRRPGRERGPRPPSPGGPQKGASGAKYWRRAGVSMRAGARAHPAFHFAKSPGPALAPRPGSAMRPRPRA